MDEQIALAPALQQAAAIRDRQISSVELLDLLLARIEHINPSINAVVAFDVDRAREAAKQADAATAAREQTGPLHGLPVTIKDAIEVEGIVSTGGAVELKEHVPAADAPAVARLKAAGAIVFGKTNVPRWSGDLQSFNEIYGTTNNPWDTSRVPGGSSGGAAAAVVSGLTCFEVGTDIGGSVRNPSHFCGAYGLKPSFGVIPQRGYLDHVGGGTIDADINCFGPIARDAGDLDVLLRVMAGPPPEDEPAWRIDLPAPRRDDVRGLRVGVWFSEDGVMVDEAYTARLRAAADALADAGAEVKEAHPDVPFFEQVGLFGRLISPAISVSAPEEAREALGGNHHAWLQNQKRRVEIQGRWAAWFESFDALLCPVTPTPAFPHAQEGDFASRTITINGQERSYLENVNWTGLIGVVGLPSAVPPIGPTSGGLPVGVQVVTPYLRDREAVWLAGVLGELCGGYQPPPLAT